MKENKWLMWSLLAFFVSGCAGMSKNQAAIVGATLCGTAAGAGVGVGAIHIEVKFS